MSPDAVDLLVLATGAVLLLLGCFVVDLGRPRETLLGAMLERELTAAARPPGTGWRGAGTLPPAAPLGPAGYAYRTIPPPTPGTGLLPRWLVGHLRGSDTCHTLDPENCLVAFACVRNPLQCLQAPLQWSCRALESDPGLALVLSFRLREGPHEVPLEFRFANVHELRHLLCLSQQGVLRIDFLKRRRLRRLRHAGSRLAPVPDRILHEVRQVLRDLGTEDAV